MLNNVVVVLACKFFMRPQECNIYVRRWLYANVTKSHIVTDKESLLSAITESRMWIRENLRSGFVIMLQIETRPFYINISTVHFGSSLNVFIHNYGFRKIVNL